MPLVSKTFDQLIDFTRTSSATFVGSDGLVQSTPASVNLLLYTQEFDNAAWLKINTTATANSTVAPDGTSTADTLTAAAVTGVHYIRRQIATLTASTAYAFSFYVKAGTHDFIQLANTGTTAAFANFDLANGVVGTTGVKSTASITSADNGWYRCTVVFDDTAALTNEFRIYIVSSASAAYAENWTTAGTETVFLWGAQVEVGSAATTYTRNNGGFYPPRFDYDPATLAPKGLLIEEQRTNIILRSEEFNTGTWSKSGALITADATVSPDGTVDADKMIEAAINAQHRASQAVTVTSGAAHTFSIYAKAAERTSIWVRMIGSLTFASCIVDLTNGAISTSTGTCTATNVGNGWYRITISGTSDSTTVTAYANLIDGAGANTYLGDGTSGLFIYGAQLEAGAFATSYIPTVASQVTRTSDQCSIVAPNFAPWYNQSEGSFVSEFSFFASNDTVNSKAYFAVTDGTSNNRVYGNVNASAIPFVFVAVGNVAQANMSTGTAITNNTVAKVATAYKANDFAAVLNAGTVATDTSGTVPTVNKLDIGNLNNFSQINGHIRSVRYFPVRLSNAQLQALTV